jgi:hypothetical protein
MGGFLFNNCNTIYGTHIIYNQITTRPDCSEQWPVSDRNAGRFPAGTVDGLGRNELVADE